MRKYKYVCESAIINLWRFSKDTYPELSGNKPNDWTIATAYRIGTTPKQVGFDAVDVKTKREAKRFFPLATIV